MSRFPSNKRPIVNINNNLYIVHAEYSREKVKDIGLVKQWIGVDHAFISHKDNTYVFCELIEEPKWEEIK